MWRSIDRVHCEGCRVEMPTTTRERYCEECRSGRMERCWECGNDHPDKYMWNIKDKNGHISKLCEGCKKASKESPEPEHGDDTPESENLDPLSFEADDPVLDNEIRFENEVRKRLARLRKLVEGGDSDDREGAIEDLISALPHEIARKTVRDLLDSEDSAMEVVGLLRRHPVVARDLLTPLLSSEYVDGELLDAMVSTLAASLGVHESEYVRAIEDPAIKSRILDQSPEWTSACENKGYWQEKFPDNRHYACLMLSEQKTECAAEVIEGEFQSQRISQYERSDLKSMMEFISRIRGGSVIDAFENLPDNPEINSLRSILEIENEAKQSPGDLVDLIEGLSEIEKVTKIKTIFNQYYDADNYLMKGKLLDYILRISEAVQTETRDDASKVMEEFLENSQTGESLSLKLYDMLGKIGGAHAISVLRRQEKSNAYASVREQCKHRLEEMGLEQPLSQTKDKDLGGAAENILEPRPENKSNSSSDDRKATKKKLTDLDVDEEHAHLLADDRKWDDVKILNPQQIAEIYQRDSGTAQSIHNKITNPRGRSPGTHSRNIHGQKRGSRDIYSRLPGLSPSKPRGPEEE